MDEKHSSFSDAEVKDTKIRDTDDKLQEETDIIGSDIEVDNNIGEKHSSIGDTEAIETKIRVTD